MSTESSASDDVQGRTYFIPSMLTSSLRAMFQAFGEDIVELRAHGGPTTDNTERVDALREYGVSYRRRVHQEVQIDYEKRGPKGDPINPLNKAARDEIISEIEAKLGGRQGAVTPDVPVKKLRVRIESEELKEAVPTARGTEFDLMFKSEKAEDAVKDRTRRLNSERGLYGSEGMGWNIRNLNLHLVEETAAKFDGQSDPTCMSWHGREDIRPRIDGGRIDGRSELMSTIEQVILPTEYSWLKPYVVMEDEMLDVPASLVDESDEEAENERGDLDE